MWSVRVEASDNQPQWFMLESNLCFLLCCAGHLPCLKVEFSTKLQQQFGLFILDEEMRIIND